MSQGLTHLLKKSYRIQQDVCIIVHNVSCLQLRILEEKLLQGNVNHKSPSGAKPDVILMQFIMRISCAFERSGGQNRFNRRLHNHHEEVIFSGSVGHELHLVQ